MKNLISWVEVPATNFERAVRFYNIIFNIDFEILDCGDEQMAFFPNGEGAISKAPDFYPSENGVLVSFNSFGKLNSILEKAQQNGGKIVREKTKIEAEGRGYFAIIMDCEGNKIGLYED